MTGVPSECDFYVVLFITLGGPAMMKTIRGPMCNEECSVG